MDTGMNTVMSFGDRLGAATAAVGRLCVGIDPHGSLLRQWGLDESVEGVDRFAGICVEAMAGRVAMVKPQVAFFERWGARGYAVLERTIRDLRSAGTLVLADAKRGDIGSTLTAYAQAWLDPASPLSSDAVTVSPSMGMGALAPAIELAAATGKGVYVLAATSNPEAAEIQLAELTGGEDAGKSVSQHVVDTCAGLNEELCVRTGARFGHVGIVLGATLGMPGARPAPRVGALRGSLLLPGVGAQGAGVEDVERLSAGGCEPVAMPSVSRGILRAGPSVAKLREEIERQSHDFPSKW